MLLTEYDEAGTMELFKEEGHAEGQVLGMDRLGRLMKRLLSLGRTGDAVWAADDREYRDHLFEEYGIE